MSDLASLTFLVDERLCHPTCLFAEGRHTAACICSCEGVHHGLARDTSSNSAQERLVRLVAATLCLLESLEAVGMEESMVLEDVARIREALAPPIVRIGA